LAWLKGMAGLPMGVPDQLRADFFRQLLKFHCASPRATVFLKSEILKFEI
jgi:hypothetical protein